MSQCPQNIHLSEDSDDYGFFCDLESAKTMEYDELVYYVVTTKTHYEVRRKSVNRPFIHGHVLTKCSNLSATKSSIDNLPQIRANTMDYKVDSTTTDSGKKPHIATLLQRISRDVCYSVIVCFTTISCLYFVMTQPPCKD